MLSLFLDPATSAAHPPYGQIAEYGIVGVLLLVSLGVIRHLYKELKASREEIKEEMRFRIEDAQKYNALSLTIQKEVNDTVTKLGDWFEILEKRDPRNTDEDKRR